MDVPSKFLRLLLIPVFFLPLAGKADVLVLKNGTEIHAPYILFKDDVYVVNIGKEKPLVFSKDEIERITRASVALYRTNRAGEPFEDVKTAAEKVEEASVLVRNPGGLGSGFVIDPRGYVITNAHVIDGTTKVEVTVFKKTENGLERQVHKKIKILAVNRRDDLALLKIEPEKELKEGEKPLRFKSVPMGDSLSVSAGDAVFAIGSPQGLDRTVSSGTVSTTERELGEAGVFIQHDAPINPGNSGGPLFNLKGEVVGVNSRKGMNSDGLGFAIPSSLVKFFLDHRDGYAFDPSSQNGGYIYNRPPTAPGNRNTDELHPGEDPDGESEPESGTTSGEDSGES
ncbi:MAG: trypsin-like serine protease [Verrucomicrobiales bacterium]|nr:trypsin-like serine protease [Verrucomicrobiales bacterium]